MDDLDPRRLRGPSPRLGRAAPAAPGERSLGIFPALPAGAAHRSTSAVAPASTSRTSAGPCRPGRGPSHARAGPGGGPGVSGAQADLAAPAVRPPRPGRGVGPGVVPAPARRQLPVALAQLHRALAVGAPLEMTLRAGAGEGPCPTTSSPGRFFAHWGPTSWPRWSPAPASSRRPGVTITGPSGDWLTVRARAARTLPDSVGSGHAVAGLRAQPEPRGRRRGVRLRRARPTVLAGRGRRRPGGRGERPASRCGSGADGVGMTDLVKRATPTRRKSTAAEYRPGLARVAWLVGVAAARAWCCSSAWRDGGRRRPPAPSRAGSAAGFGGAAVYVMPSTSGLQRRLQPRCPGGACSRRRRSEQVLSASRQLPRWAPAAGSRRSGPAASSWRTCRPRSSAPRR